MDDRKPFRYNPAEEEIEEIYVDYEKVIVAHLPAIVFKDHIISPLTEKEKDEMNEKELEEFKNNYENKEEENKEREE